MLAACIVRSAANRRMTTPLFVKTLQSHRRTLSFDASSIGRIAVARHGNKFHPFYQWITIPQNHPWIQVNGGTTHGHATTANRFYSQLFMSAVDEDEDIAWRSSTETMDRTWNIGGLKKEVQRNIFRCHKKVGKANERLQSAKAIVERLKNPNYDASVVTMEDLENCPDVEALALEVDELKTRLRNLNRLEEALRGVKNSTISVALPDEVAGLALDLGVSDEPPQRKEGGPPKQKGPRASERLPYRRYYSFNNVEIRVGKKAEDNDELTLSPKHRNGSDWWMHASSCAGSHVVIRCSDEKLAEDVVMDAAALAARQSKNKRSKIVKVSLTRCRDISKPAGSKAGLVRLTGNIRTITVDMNQAETRLQRLDKTELIN
jgi:predicted ribosome quality control (RQC) complex YloA/Tae2 family protein